MLLCFQLYEKEDQICMDQEEILKRDNWADSSKKLMNKIQHIWPEF